MSESERLEVEVDLLLSLNYVQAWTGSLDNLKQSSYVLYADIIKMLNERRAKIKQLNMEGDA